MLLLPLLPSATADPYTCEQILNMVGLGLSNEEMIAAVGTSGVDRDYAGCLDTDPSIPAVVRATAKAHLVDVPDVVETEATFAGNAMLKARAMCAATGVPAVADDSGLCVDALNGMPGVLSARWSGPPKSDDRNNSLLLAQLADVPDDRRGA